MVVMPWHENVILCGRDEAVIQCGPDRGFIHACADKDKFLPAIAINIVPVSRERRFPSLIVRPVLMRNTGPPASRSLMACQRAGNTQIPDPVRPGCEPEIAFDPYNALPGLRDELSESFRIEGAAGTVDKTADAIFFGFGTMFCMSVQLLKPCGMLMRTIKIKTSRIQDLKQAQLLMQDMLELAELYSAVSGHRNLRVRLEKITTDSCRKFHVDCVDLRLLRTYVGPGVQWTADQGHSVHEASTGSVVFLKGKHFPGWEGAEKIRHRSPPLSSRPAAERIRLLLTIDEAGACADANFDMVA